MSTRSPPVDVAVAGAGIAGLTTALALAQHRSPRVSVTVCDPSLGVTDSGRRSLRAVAISAGSRRLFERLGVWQAIAGTAQPMRDMVLTDSRVGAVPPPVFLNFGGEVEPGEPFAHMVLHDALREALLQACRAAGIPMVAEAVRDFENRHGRLTVSIGSTPLACRLLVVADGTRSRLRDRAGIGVTGWDYDQAGITATLAHERPHDGRATQHFLPGGPLALLPMRADDGSERRISIVWSERLGEAERLAGLPDEAFVEALQARIGHGLGPMRLEDRPVAYRLRVGLARRLVADRLALVGDAARTVHPLAGQGLNLGIRDAAALAEAVAAQCALGLDPGDPAVLHSYQQARRADSVAMAATTDLLNRLFSNDATPVRLLRDIGLGLVDRMPGLKRWLIREAAGTAWTAERHTEGLSAEERTAEGAMPARGPASPRRRPERP